MKERNICINCGAPLDGSGRCPKCGHIEWIPVSNPELEKDTILNQKRYQIIHVLGSGGFAITYMANDRTLNRTVAIKECFPKRIATRNEQTGEVVPKVGFEQKFQQEKARFLQEARSLAQLTALPHIVNVQDCFEDNNTAYIVMEHIHGVSLYKYVKKRQFALSVDEMLAYILPVLEDLQKVHEKGVIHKDISPDNIMVPNDGNNRDVKLIDFGAAQDLDEESTKTSQYKRGFAPIEQYQNESEMIGPWTDVYAVCATIYWLLSKQRLPDAPERTDKDKSYSLQKIGVIVPPKLDKILQKGLACNPQNRIESAEKLKKMLQKVPTKPYARAWAKASVLTLACAAAIGYTTWTFAAPDLQSYREKKEAQMEITSHMIVTASLSEQKDSILWNNMKAVTVSEALASSEYTGVSGRSFEAKNVIDQDPATAWGESVEGTGLGEEIMLKLEEEGQIRAIQARFGDAKDEESYQAAGRPRVLKIKTDTQTFEIKDIPDKNEEVYIVFSEPVKTSTVTFEIEEVYTGTQDYTCISELSLFEMK